MAIENGLAGRHLGVVRVDRVDRLRILGEAANLVERLATPIWKLLDGRRVGREELLDARLGLGFEDVDNLVACSQGVCLELSLYVIATRPRAVPSSTPYAVLTELAPGQVEKVVDILLGDRHLDMLLGTYRGS